VEHVPSLSRPFPWRTATLVVGALAAVELVALALVGGTRLAHLVRPLEHTSGAAAKTAPAPAHRAATHVKSLKLPAIASHPLLPRARVAVLVLNGNGASGAAAAEAARIQGRGYPLPAAKNASRHDYARSMVLFRPGYAVEARRLAHDIRIRLVSPVDGLSKAQLRGSQLVVILGGS
jgi:LytR cell envelope-related transcriptional attenuator